ncbi:hypothetical protein KGA66_20890 [Actinocrinis puniceicyclus]|uniref:PH domain-containing protein n=1 Tax=Actinocrinis puniceicyclus TaxID=977794 RepID=A0A8J7WSV1_9ACTN|nr:hypothetical protein [Actinocrinis puniceicyclus]MBS2965519.1 hypothetical protein [Actinocrinis puniceicyclus]
MITAAGPSAVAASAARSAPVTHWGGRVLAMLLILALLSGGYWLMWRGWKNRAARQAGLPVPSSVPPDGDELGEPVEGVYASTTKHGDWLDRIAVHGLGVRGSAWVRVGRSGVLFEREAAPDVFVPAEDVQAVQTAPGIAGKVTGGEGLVVLTWRLGGHVLDTGFQPRAKADRARLIDGVDALLTERTNG